RARSRGRGGCGGGGSRKHARGREQPTHGAIVPEGRFVPYIGEMSDQRTVRVATCNDQAESALIRAVLSAHGIEAIIPGDAVPHMGLGGVAFQSVVFVREDQAEDAAALIADMREGRAVEGNE